VIAGNNIAGDEYKKKSSFFVFFFRFSFPLKWFFAGKINNIDKA